MMAADGLAGTVGTDLAVLLDVARETLGVLAAGVGQPEPLPEKVVLEGTRLAARGTSLQNTAELALGLAAAGRAGLDIGLDSDRVGRVVWERLDAQAPYQTLAFVLWAEAVGGGARVDEAWRRLRAALPRSATQSMDLAWVLDALCAYLPCARDGRAVAELAEAVFERIAANQSRRSGLFHGSARREGWLRRRVATATLSSQVFPIRALASYAATCGRKEALTRAGAALDALSSQQGTRGQWWRRYEVATGRPVECYPVHSVSQLCTVPSAVLAFERAGGGTAHTHAARKGMGWVFGDNELGRTLRDGTFRAVWSGIGESMGKLEIVREMYSYFPGRCLLLLATMDTASVSRSGWN